MKQELMSLKEAAEYLDQSERTLYNWIKDGKLPAYQPGKHIKIKKVDADKLIEESIIQTQGQF